VTNKGSFRAAALAAAALLLTACGGGDDDLVYPTETRPLTPAGEVIPPRASVTVRLPDPANARFAGYYAAEEQGFYEERKLDVAFRPGNPERAVSMGQAEFGLGAVPDLLSARERGIDLVTLAQVFRNGDDVIFADATWISRPANRDTAVRFLEASFEGWVYCRDHPAACRRLVLDRQAAVAESNVKKVNALIWPSEHRVGTIDVARFGRAPGAYRDDHAVLARTEHGHEGLDLTGAGWKPR
jgi:ABC-type nitrate/sulfonate/bicarbonate transport system substrate-binding protein